MSETEQNNICPTCGGVLLIEYTIQFREACPHSMSVSSTERICFGHPEPEPEQKHDGQLGGEADVCYSKVTTSLGIADGIRIEHNDLWDEDIIGLHPSQALSLLAWLKQEESALEQMVKEQEE